MEFVEEIVWMGQPLSYIIRRELSPTSTVFLTPAEFTQQLGFVVYPTGGEVKPHLHRSLERKIKGTSEVLLVRKGRCEVDIYDHAKELARILHAIPSVSVDPDEVETNILFFEVKEAGRPSADIAGALRQEGLLVSPVGGSRFRAVTHLDVGSADIRQAGTILSRVLAGPASLTGSRDAH